MSRFSIAKDAAVSAIDDLVPELFGGGRRDTHRYNNRWAVTNKWRGGAKLEQMSVWRDGGRRGAFRDYAGEARGDAIDLVAYGLTGQIDADTRMRAVEWLEERFGIRRMSPEKRAELEATATANAAAREAAQTERRAKNHTRARKAFYASREIILDTPVEIYLAHRGVDLRAVPNLSAAIRYRPECLYWLGGRPAPLFDAMLCAMIDVDGHIGANHYTFLEPGGRGKLQTGRRGYLDQDGEAHSSKLMFPENGGLTIPLTYGPSGVKHYKAEQRSDLIGLTEGIEDALTAALVDNSLRMHAVGSLAGLLTVPDFPCAMGYLVFRDNDWSKPQAVALFERGLARLRSFGKPVEIAAVPEDWGKDVNETLNG